MTQRVLDTSLCLFLHDGQRVRMRDMRKLPVALLCRSLRAFTKIISSVLMHPSRPPRGVRPIVTEREAGCDGRCWYADDVCPTRTVKPCGPVPPMQGTTPGSRARGDGGNKAGSPGRSRSSRKTIAQGVP